MATSAGYITYITPETSTWGSIPGSPTWIMLPTEPTSGIDVVETLSDDARRGLAAIGFRQMEGVHRTELSVSGPVYPEELGHLVRSIIGADTYTSSTAANHVFDVQSMATAAGRSFQLGIRDDSVAAATGYTHEGCVVTGLTLRWNASEGLLNYEASILGKGMVTDTSITAVSDATNEPFRGWHANVTTSAALNTGANTRLIEAEISIARDADLLYVCQNDKFPVKLIPGLVAVTGRFTASMDLIADVDIYRDLTLDEPLVIEFTYGTGASLKSFDLNFPKASYGDSPAEVDRSGNNMTIAYNFRGLIGTSDADWKAAASTNVRVRMRNSEFAAYGAGS